LFKHHLRPLIMPDSVALIGASERAGSLGRIVFENLLAGGFRGTIHAVNPNHRKILGHKVVPTLAATKAKIDLAVIATPCDTVVPLLNEGAEAGVKCAVLLTAPPHDSAHATRWERDILAATRKHRIRLLGPEAFGVIRTDIGLNVTIGNGQALPGRLALVTQSGAICSALIDFATPLGIGFSSVLALGGALDIDFGELLDFLLLDPHTDGILLYLESLHDARRFLSVLRAAARTKPIIVLKAGRTGARAEDPLDAAGAPSPDKVFSAALQRAGTVRVETYTQLFAAARILSLGRIPRGERLAIVTNGRGPGLMAADAAARNGIPLAEFTKQTFDRLNEVLPADTKIRNPLDVHGTAPPALIAAAVSAALADENTDAVAVLHVPLPASPSTDTARAVAGVARGAGKLVLASWMGAVDRNEARQALEAGGVANFYTPENAVDAYSFLAAYRRNQAWLLEVPPPQPEPQPSDLAAAERVRDRALAAGRRVLTDVEAHQLLAAFAIPAPLTLPAETLSEAINAARQIGYPVALKLYADAALHPHQVVLSRLNLRNRAALSRAYGEMLADARAQDSLPRPWHLSVQKMVAVPRAREVAIGVSTDPVFGPVIAFGNGGMSAAIEPDKAVMLPPLNARLALDLILGTRAGRFLGTTPKLPAADLEPVVKLLLQVSSLVCALPWVRDLELNPVQVGARSAAIVDIRIVIEPKRRPHGDRYRHMAIHPYPMELVHDVALKDGTALHVRPIRPEDAELERAFVGGLSEQTRYFRFMHHLPQLTPQMLARFTQVDYDREMALVAIDGEGDAAHIVGVARYVTNPDQESAEFAVVIGDSWQGRGVGSMLMRELLACGKARDLARIEGVVLKQNHGMLRLMEALGFAIEIDPDDPEQVRVVRRLDTWPKA
jgi:acetyltransferase